jgi:hypothetical protein
MQKRKMFVEPFDVSAEISRHRKSARESEVWDKGGEVDKLLQHEFPVLNRYVDDAGVGWPTVQVRGEISLGGYVVCLGRRQPRTKPGQGFRFTERAEIPGLDGCLGNERGNSCMLCVHE